MPHTRNAEHDVRTVSCSLQPCFRDVPPLVRAALACLWEPQTPAKAVPFALNRVRTRDWHSVYTTPLEHGDPALAVRSAQHPSL
eukprot:5531325-Prymnesium_polylepis.2